REPDDLPGQLAAGTVAPAESRQFLVVLGLVLPPGLEPKLGRLEMLRRTIDLGHPTHSFLFPSNHMVSHAGSGRTEGGLSTALTAPCRTLSVPARPCRAPHVQDIPRVALPFRDQLC